VRNATTIIGLAAAFAVLGYLNIQDFHRNQECEARRGTEECYTERLKEDLQQRLKELQAEAKELEQQTEELRRKYGPFGNSDGRGGGPIPIPPTHPPDDRPIAI
jgi:hypothetical protein